jgi:hypothetical protein
MDISSSSNGYSANVRLTLVVDGRSFKLAQTGPDFVILREPMDLPPSEAEIVTDIDGQVERWRVHLPEGAHSDKLQVRAVDSLLASSR